MKLKNSLLWVLFCQTVRMIQNKLRLSISMFKKWAKYRIILVSGPRRSGTRIASKMIASNTSHKYIDEDNFKVSNLKLFEEFINSKSPLVIQCPSMSYRIEKYSAPDTLIVFMLRDLKDIVASQTRIGWAWWNKKNFKNYPNYKLRTRASLAGAVYAYWEKKQKNKIQNYSELEYELLSNHKLWIAKEKRINFKHNQTKSG